MDWREKIVTVKAWFTWSIKERKVNWRGLEAPKIIIVTAVVSKDGEKEDNWEENEIDRRKSWEKGINNSRIKCWDKAFVTLMFTQKPKVFRNGKKIQADRTIV